MNVRPITPQTGGTPAPADVVGRDELIITMLARFREGTNFIISDPRRMGKTALLIRLCNEPGDGMHAVLVDVEGATSLDDVAVKIFEAIRGHRSLPQKAKDVLTTFIDGTSVEAGPITLSTTAKGLTSMVALEQAIDSINKQLAKDDEYLIIAVDEVTKALENLCDLEDNEASVLLQVLHRLRSRPGGRVRWILTGSVGFHHVIRMAGMTEGAMAEAEILDLGPLAPAEAVELTHCLLIGIDREAGPEVVEALVERTSAIPFLLHQAIAPLRAGSGAVDLAEAMSAYDTYINDKSRSAPATHLVTRLKPYYDDEALATKVLNYFARADGSVSFDEVCAAFLDVERDAMMQLIDHLTLDHYLDSTGTRWRYGALREIWKLRKRIA